MAYNACQLLLSLTLSACRNDRKEFLAMLGMIGACYSAIAAAIFGDFHYVNSANFTFAVCGLVRFYMAIPNLP